MENSSTLHEKVQLLNPVRNEPSFIFQEVDLERWELRKVEVYPNGSMEYASEDKCSSRLRLSVEPLPTLVEIAQNPRFKPESITAEEFERMWDLATR